MKTQNNIVQITRPHQSSIVIRLMQASMEQLVDDLGLLVPLVDLVKEGLQNSLDCLARLGLDVGNQLVVTLPLVLMENLLGLYINQERTSPEQNIYENRVLESSHM
jgi:hypothetical protein